MYKAILTAAALALSAPLTPALAHDDDDNRYSGYSAHSRFHDSHEEGFSSWREHRAFIVRLDICTGSTTRMPLLLVLSPVLVTSTQAPRRGH